MTPEGGFLQLWGFYSFLSPVSLLMFDENMCAKALLHSLQPYGLSLVWVRWCWMSFALLRKAFLQSLHSSSFSSLWILWCLVRSDLKKRRFFRIRGTHRASRLCGVSDGQWGKPFGKRPSPTYCSHTVSPWCESADVSWAGNLWLKAFPHSPHPVGFLSCVTALETHELQPSGKGFPTLIRFMGLLSRMSSLMFSELKLHECFPTCVASVGLLSPFSSLMSNELCLPGECFPALTACIWLPSWTSFLTATERWFSATGFHTTMVFDSTKSFIILEADRWFPIPTEPIRVLSCVSSILDNKTQLWLQTFTVWAKLTVFLC